jgi:drug/metabolite transporter (DMT)-like permease
LDAVNRIGTLLCLLSAASFGSMAIFGKLAYEAGVDVPTLLFVRFGLAAVVLWAVVAVTRRTLPPRGVIAAALALGGIGYATQAGLFFAALERMDASLLALLLYTYPAMVTVAAILIGRERADRRRVTALVLSSAGLVLVLAASAGARVDGLAVGMGIAAALTYTIYILVSDRATAGADPIVLSALVALGAATTFGVSGVARGAIDTGFATEGWLWLGAIAVVCTAVAVVSFFAGMRRVGPSAAAILSTFEPVVTVLLALAVFGESLSAGQLVGGALVLSAVVVLNAVRRSRVPSGRAWVTTRKLRSNTS